MPYKLDDRITEAEQIGSVLTREMFPAKGIQSTFLTLTTGKNIFDIVPSFFKISSISCDVNFPGVLFGYQSHLSNLR